jgi:hypothetical protein
MRLSHATLALTLVLGLPLAICDGSAENIAVPPPTYA